jgi:predicted MFS family arabinose efflux permease
VFAAHQFGAAIAATAAGLTRDHLGTYAPAWYVAGGLCFVAALLSINLVAPPRPVRAQRHLAAI